jgi:PhoPQ-activated pathogenicity-related protein
MLTLAVLFPTLSPREATADLDAYLAKPEPVYRWEKRGEEKRDGCTIYDLHLVSQTWQGMTWEHRLQIFRPEKLTYPRFCTLYNTGGNGSESNTRQGIRIATATGAVCATVYGIPRQPLYDGKVEDALVVHTWLKYLETGDESWPLHFPMAKAVLKAMDAIQAFTKESGKPAIDSFLVFGASKRGWTTWLVGASRDPRVKAIAPMVIDVLNVAKQAAHQRQSYGAFSEQVDDYTRAGIPEKFQTPEGRRLLELEDP